jgi:hypothetical protein
MCQAARGEDVRNVEYRAKIAQVGLDMANCVDAYMNFNVFFLDGDKRHTFRVTLADLDGISPQLDTQVDLVALVEHFLVVFLEPHRLFHERTDSTIDAVVVGWVGHVSIFGVCMQLCYELQKDGTCG